MDLWSSGHIKQLLHEGMCIQTRMISQVIPKKNDIDGYILRSLMAQGKVKSALNYHSRDKSGGCLGFDDIIPESQ